MQWRDVKSDDGYYIEFEGVGKSGKVWRVEWAEDSTHRPWRVGKELFRTEPDAKRYCEAQDALIPASPRIEWQEVLRAVTDDYKHNYEVDSGSAFERVWNLLRSKGVAA